MSDKTYTSCGSYFAKRPLNRFRDSIGLPVDLTAIATFDQQTDFRLRARINAAAHGPCRAAPFRLLHQLHDTRQRLQRRLFLHQQVALRLRIFR